MTADLHRALTASVDHLADVIEAGDPYDDRWDDPDEGVDAELTSEAFTAALAHVTRLGFRWRHEAAAREELETRRHSAVQRARFLAALGLPSSPSPQLR